MRCSSCKPLIDRYADGSLSTTQLLRLSHHLEDCAQCGTLLHELRSVDGLLRTMTPAEPSTNFSFAVMAEVRTMPAPRAAASNIGALIAGYTVVSWAIIALWMRVSGISVHTAMNAALASLSRANETLHAVGSGALSSFGSSTPVLTAYVAGVLALDLVVAAGIIFIYFYLRPRLAAHLASAREAS